uniref:Protein kinase domain-containing protein n=1 Tax=Haemonchus contortus TaxID=6289 RepID=A0A7I4Y3H3_HAECO
FVKNLRFCWSEIRHIVLKMSDCGCEVSIDVPTWAPAAIAFAVSVAVAIAVIVAYVLREMERHKTFYGREDKLSSREQLGEIKKKEEMDAYVLGRTSEEVLVIKSPAQKSPGAPGTARSGVKVMLRKKRIITTTPSKPPPTSIPGSLEQVSPNVVNFTIVYDKTGRAFELIDVLNKEPVVMGTRSKRAETLIQQIKDRLEAMTNHSFIVYGNLADSKWLVKGLENLEDNVEETNLQLRLNVDALGLKIMAYKMQAISAENAMMMSIRARTSEALPPEPTQATPASRWIARLGTTPQQGTTPNLETPHPESRRKSTEELDRRNKEMLRDAAKNLRQAIQSPTMDGGYSFSSPDRTNGIEKMSGTRKSLRGTPKGAMKRSFGPRSKEGKERYHKTKGFAEATPTRRSLDAKERHSPASSGTALGAVLIPTPPNDTGNGERKQRDLKTGSMPKSTVKKTQTSAEYDFKARKPTSIVL